MKSFKLRALSCKRAVKRPLWVLLTALLLLPVVQGQRRSTPKRPPEHQTEPSVSFDTLLAADSYKIYGEVRSVGQLIRSEGVKDLLNPVVKLAAPPKEFKSLVKWLDARADLLMTSRLLFVAWPSRPKLPRVLVAIEFPSAEEAQKFEPQLKELLPKLIPSPASSLSPNQTRVEPADAKQNEKLPSPSYVLKHAGSLVFISDLPFAFKDLRPVGNKLLAEDQNFHMVHDRFNSESVFLYFDAGAIEKEEKERRQKFEVTQKQAEAEATNQVKPDAEIGDEVSAPEGQPLPITPSESTQPQTIVTTELSTQASSEQTKVNGPNPDIALYAISNGFFGGQMRWPEGIGAAFAFEDDSYVVRVLLINSPDVKGSLIPFVPQFVSGPALVPESPSILPSDTELFVTASVDFPQIYEGMLKAAQDQSEIMQTRQRVIQNTESTSPFAVYEKKLGIKLKDDLLPLLGNEVAFTIPVRAFDGRAPEPQASPNQSGGEAEKQKPAEMQEPNPIFAIALKDREAVRTLLPRIVDSLGFKGANMLAQTEKRDDTELVTFGNIISYAFVGNFLVLSPDAKATRHVVDSYLNHETLSSSIHFRNYTRWQPRQVLGQVYVSPALMESYSSTARDANPQLSDQLRDFLMMLGPVAQPITYAISNEGLGPLHELHVPKNLALLIMAGISHESNQAPIATNEAIMRSVMRAIASAEATYEATEGSGRYGTLNELIKSGLIAKEMVENHGYKIELIVSNKKFEVTAIPLEYGKTGKLSFFSDESSVLRAGDHGGGSATIADKAMP